MTCNNCGFHNREFAKYCCNCGNKLNKSVTAPLEEKLDDYGPEKFCYAICYQIDENGVYYFNTLSYQLLTKLKHEKLNGEMINVCDTTWLSVREKRTGDGIFVKPANGSCNTESEIKSLLKQYKSGDLMVGPILEKHEDYIKVGMSPNVYGMVRREDIFTASLYDKTDERKLFEYEILKIKMEGDKFYTTLRPVNYYIFEYDCKKFKLQ